jgi:hypothetical protein
VLSRLTIGLGEYTSMPEQSFQDLFSSAYGRAKTRKVQKATDLRESIQADAATQLGHPDFEDLRLGETNEGEGVVFFLDIRSFTKLSFVLSNEELLWILQGLTEASVRSVIQFGGHVIEFTGDGIIQAEFPDGRSDYHARHRSEIAGPVAGFDVWWNAFHYRFREDEHTRQRVAVEFQAGTNPYETESESIDATIQRESRNTGYGSRGFASAVLPPMEALGESRVAISDNEFLLSAYQDICKGLSRELDKAEMEVDLEAPGGPCLVVLDGDRSVKCSIFGDCDSAVRVVVAPQAGQQVAFEVPCKRRRIDSLEVRRIVACVVSQIKPKDDQKSRHGKRA